MKKILKNFLVIICSLIFVVGGLYGTYMLFFNPYRGAISEYAYSADLSDNLTRNEAAADIDYILKRLKERHPACMDGIPEAVTEQSRIEKDNMPEQITILQLWQAASRILATMKDAHTGVGIAAENNYYLPLSFRFTDGKLYCMEGKFSEYEVIRIGGVSINELYQTFKSQFSYELEEFASFYFAQRCNDKSYLAFLNVDVTEPIVIVFEAPSGEVTEIFEFTEQEKSNETNDAPFVSYELDADNGIGIFTLEACHFNDIYRKTLKEFFSEVKSNQIQTVVVDLRDNGGGNSNVANEFISYLDVDSYFVFGGVDVRFGSILWKYKKSETINIKKGDLLFHGDVYVITSSLTFSAATDFAVMISDNKLGKIVGEVSGGMPSSYGDILRFQTPNAKLPFSISYKYFRRPDGSKDDQPLIPDYPVSAHDALNMIYEMID